MTARTKLLLWEIVCIFWVATVGSLLHFAFELSDYWTPMAFFAAVNESAWEHVKMYFWPGLFFALAQYTYTRHLANNYWLGKALALLVTPLVIFVCYFSYMAWVQASGARVTLWIMLMIMTFGITAGQLTSWFVLTREPLGAWRRPAASGIYVTLLLAFSTFTFFPPRVFLFNNFFCYQYTNEFGILDDYGPYRVFTRGEDGSEAGGVFYCDNLPGTDGP
ncbi:MAG: hypothetical protein JJT85_11390 [Chromatiales bacterium]|nr:hypothetical protein [Chromatiales bacterium]